MNPTPTPHRRQQLRAAKRAQRARDRETGVVTVEIKLPEQRAAQLKTAMRGAHWADDFAAFLDQRVVRIADYPQLRDIAWNRHDEWIEIEDAFRLYERNWRYVEQAHLDDRERAFIQRLADVFGNGVIHA